MKVYVGNHLQTNGKPQNSISDLVRLLGTTNFQPIEEVFDLPRFDEPCLFIENFSCKFLDSGFYNWMQSSRNASLLLTEHFYAHEGLIFYNGRYIFSRSAGSNYMSNAVERAVNLIQIAPLFDKVYSHWGTPDPSLSEKLLSRDVIELSPSVEFKSKLAKTTLGDSRNLFFFGKVTEFRGKIINALRDSGLKVSILDNVKSNDIAEKIQDGFTPIHIPISERSAPFSPTRAFTAWDLGSKIIQPNGLHSNPHWANLNQGFHFCKNYDEILRHHNYIWTVRGDHWMDKNDQSYRLPIELVRTSDPLIAVGDDLRIPLRSPLSFTERLARIISILPEGSVDISYTRVTKVHALLRKLSKALAAILPFSLYIKAWKLAYKIYRK